MSAITAELVKDLREKTGAGMMDCKKALTEAAGDMEKAAELLRKKGLAAAAKKADRVAAEGMVEAYIHGAGRIGVLVEVNCETDFVAKNDQFRELARNIALQIAASAPKYVSRDEVSAAEVEKEKEFLRSQALAEGKPAAVVEKMIEGRLNKFYEQICLLDQAYIKDPDKKVGDLITETTATIGEKIAVRRFVRFVLGEGIQKQTSNLAEEVAAQLSKS